MFAKTIIDSDAFLDMPLSSQSLYFHLSMRADDDGFINNPKKTQRMIGASEDDLKLLIAKRFILPFDSGVVVIKHWKIHNYIQKDRYKPTIYQEEKAQIAVKGNKAYTDDLQNVYITDTQDRLGKDRLELGKDSIGKREGKKKKSSGENEYQQIADLFNSLCPSLPSVKILSKTIKSDLKESLKLYSLDDFKRVFEKAEKSSFLKGENERKWVAPFDWLIKAENIAKVLNGNFDNNDNTAEYKGAYSLELFEQMLNGDYEPEEPPKTIANDESIMARANALKEQFA